MTATVKAACHIIVAPIERFAFMVRRGQISTSHGYRTSGSGLRGEVYVKPDVEGFSW